MNEKARQDGMSYWGLPLLIVLIFIARYLGSLAYDVKQLVRSRSPVTTTPLQSPAAAGQPIPRGTARSSAPSAAPR